MDREYFYNALTQIRRVSYGIVVATSLLLGGAAYNHNDIGDNERAIEKLVEQVEKNQNKIIELHKGNPVHVKAELSEGTQQCLCIRLGVAIKSADKDNNVFRCT